MKKTVVQSVREQFAPASAVLSLYCDTDRSRRSPGKISIDLKNLHSQTLRLIEDWPREEQASVSGPLAEFFSHVENLSTGLPRGWVLFVSPRIEPFSLPLPGSVATKVGLSGTPRLFPLIQTLSPFRETLVVLVDKESVVYLRRYGAELKPLHRRDVAFPAGVRTGGRGGMEERRIERRVEEETDRLLREIAAEARETFSGGTFRRILTAGPRELTMPLTDFLQEQFPKEEIDSLPETHERDEGTLQELLDQWAQARFWQEGEDLIERILAEALKGGPAAVGWRAVLAASNRGAIHQLLLESYELRRGVRCSQCGALGLDEATCPLCGSETVEEPDLTEALIDQVYEKDGEVLVLSRPSALRDWEGKGALLRFAL